MVDEEDPTITVDVDGEDYEVGLVGGNFIVSNGVGHKINEVILPDSATKTITDIVQEKDNLSIFFSGLEHSELDDVFNGEGPFTVFAPSDEALMAINSDLEVMSPEETSTMISYMVVADVLLSNEMSAGDSVPSITGDSLSVTLMEEGDNDAILINGAAAVIEANILAKNGVIHIIDQAVYPPTEGK